MEMIFHSPNKTHFHKKGCALLKVSNFATQKWPIRFEYGYMSGNPGTKSCGLKNIAIRVVGALGCSFTQFSCT